jgi:hypothetical protein
MMYPVLRPGAAGQSFAGDRRWPSRPAARARSQGIHKITSIFWITLSDERFGEIAKRVADLRGRWRETDGGVGCSDWAF